jgi:hypothetical protein
MTARLLGRIVCVALVMATARAPESYNRPYFNRDPRSFASPLGCPGLRWPAMVTFLRSNSIVWRFIGGRRNRS